MEALPKQLVKTISSLGDAKGRRRSGLFVAEGTKCVTSLASRFKVARLLALPEWIEDHGTLEAERVDVCAPGNLRQITRLSSTPPVIALFHLPEVAAPRPQPDGGFAVALDCVQDPGNLGTIIRTCDWMGVRTIIASADTADAFNPKVVQATMGSLANIDIFYTDLPQYLRDCSLAVYGTFLGGRDAFACPPPQRGVLVLGNEGNGISPQVESAIHHRLTLPCAPGTCAESLNVATAGAMLLALRQQAIQYANG